MKASFDKFNRYEIPQISLCNPSSRASIVDGKTVISNIVGVLDVIPPHLVLNFNAPHEFTFEYVRHLSNNSIKQSFYDNLYNNIETDRYIYIEDVGFFIISNITNSNEDGKDKKTVICESCEVELKNYEGLYIKEDTYELHTVNHSGLLDLVVANCPGWELGYIDDALIGKSFYFKETETDNAYDFLYTDIQEMAECIIEPNIITRTINVYSREYYADSHKTSIHLAKSNLLKHRVIEDDNEDKYTALVVKGDNDLDILFVNPIGDNVIYNFTPRLPWMSAQLQDAVNRWTAKVNSVEEEYIELSRGYYGLQQEILIKEAEFNTLKSELDMLVQDRDNIISNLQGYKIEEQQQALNTVNNNIVAKINDMATLQAELNSKKEEAKNNYKNPIDTINAECALALTAKDISGNNIFTQELLDELVTHIKATEYTDEYMTVTDSMTYPERFSQAEKLMNRSKAQLVKISSGKKTYSVNTSSFLFNKRFAYFIEQLVPGAIVYVETENDIMEQLHLTAIDIDFKEKNTDFTLGNKYDRSDLQKLYEDTLGNNSKTSVAIKYITDIIENQKNRLDSYDNYINSMLTLTVNHVLNSDDESFVIDNRGITGRVRQYENNNKPKVDANGNPVFDPEQIKMIHNGLYITNDNWQTIATAIGKIAVGQNPDGTIKYDYGVIGKTIIGQLLLGNRLALYGGSVDGDGNYSITLDNNGLVIINDGNSAGITIKDASDNKQFYADSEGNLHISGIITANQGNVGGWYINPTSLISEDEKTGMSSSDTYTFWAGGTASSAPFRVTKDGTLYATGATISGNITANSVTTDLKSSLVQAIKAEIGELTVDSLSVSQITGGKNYADIKFYGPITCTDINASGYIEATSGIIGKYLNIADSGLNYTYYDNYDNTYVDYDIIKIKTSVSGAKDLLVEINCDTINAVPISTYYNPLGGYGGALSGSWNYGTSEIVNRGDLSSGRINTIAASTIDSSNGGVFIYYSTQQKARLYASPDDFYIGGNGDIKIGASKEVKIYSYNQTEYNFVVNAAGGWLRGSWYVDNEYDGSGNSISSDINKKHSIVDMPEQYSTFFDNINPVIYKYNNGTSDRYHTGFIAQEVESALNVAKISTQDFAGLVIDNMGKEDESYYLRYSEFVALNTWQIQKAKARITELEEKVANLEARLLQ